MSAAKHIINFVLNESPDDDFETKDLTAGDQPVSQPDPYDIWWETYKPIQNDAVDQGENAPFDGAMFETFGREFERIRATPDEHVWTYVTGDNGEDVIVAGRHFVNRVGYFVTEKPWADGTEAFTFGEGDPHDTKSFTEFFLNNELSRDWINEWESLSPAQRIAKVTERAEEFDLQDKAGEIVAEMDRWVAAEKARRRGEQI